MDAFDNKSDFLKSAKAARESRQKDKQLQISATKIQALIRGYLCRKQLRKAYLSEFDEKFDELDGEHASDSLITANELFDSVRKLLMVIDIDRDQCRLEKLCKCIIISIQNDRERNIGCDYISIALDKRLALHWIHQVKLLLSVCIRSLRNTSLDQNVKNQSSIALLLNVMITFTAPTAWKMYKNLQSTPNVGNQLLIAALQRLCSNFIHFLFEKQQLFQVLNQLFLESLCRDPITIKKYTLIAMLTLCHRTLTTYQFDTKSVDAFLLHIFCVPTLMHHSNQLSVETFYMFSNDRVASTLIERLHESNRLDDIVDQLPINFSICLLGNLIQLCFGHIDLCVSQPALYFKLNAVIRNILVHCDAFVQNKNTNSTHWHPILGWFSQSIEQSLYDSLKTVKLQFQLIWCPAAVQLFRDQLTKYLDDERKPFTDNFDIADLPKAEIFNCLPLQSNYPIFLKKALDLVKSNAFSSSGHTSTLGPPKREPISTHFSDRFRQMCELCVTWTTTIRTLNQLRLEVLTGLCYQDMILRPVWRIIRSLSLDNGLQFYLHSLQCNPNADSPEFAILILFCECSTHLITILDDKELYEQEKPFSIEDLIQISAFLNQLLFRIVICKQMDLESSESLNHLTSCLHSLLTLLIRRDSRREFAPKNHWLIKDLKVSALIKDLEAGKKQAAQLLTKLPHAIPHKERVQLFRQYVITEKAELGLTDLSNASPHPTLIKVHRGRLIEDGYQKLNKLNSRALKGLIRVKFINEQGLDEAGIDQDGVFKEFLEESMKKLLDPRLNLFCLTTEQRLYPSPTSNLHENHLSLFEFVGKMLAKAVYEGIVIDAPFATFFLSQLLPNTSSSTATTTGSSNSFNKTNMLYSSIDQLPSLDPELYKSLTYIKHYDGDVADLNLTFSLMDDRLGQLVTYELIPGGRSVPVTKENKIAYIHLMAHFRMHRQIDEQCAAFVRGFRAVVAPAWLAMFSAPELQRLISGDNTPVDLADLRCHTRYYGGFHNNHRLINWFWDILQNEFSNEELSLLLKFVTSCSKPPLLGFAHLQPPFTIRCVEVGEDADDGDTIGSIVRGFFAIGSNIRSGSSGSGGTGSGGRRNESISRLPTSSTCFNLLKLPNYQKKSILRDKLKYAIRSNTGFELS